MRPWLAVLFNVILTGLGYLYLGKRRLFGAILLVGTILTYIWTFTDPNAEKVLSNWWVAVASVLYLAAFGIDAYQEAKSV